MRYGLFGLALLVTAACQKADERPPGIGCGDAGCVDPGVGKSGGSGGSGGSAGAGGSAAAAGVGGESSITGSIVSLTQDDFSTAISFNGVARVAAEGAAGGWVETQANGNAFSLDGVRGGPIWAAVLPSAGQDEIATYQFIDSNAPGDKVLGTLLGSTLDLIFGVLSTPAQRSDGRGHLVINFVDLNELPKSGVSMVSPPGEFVAYKAGGTWSDTETETDNQGLVVLGNIPALADHGANNTISYQVGGKFLNVSLRVVADAVTIASVGVE